MSSLLFLLLISAVAQGLKRNAEAQNGTAIQKVSLQLPIYQILSHLIKKALKDTVVNLALPSLQITHTILLIYRHPVPV